MQVKTAHARSLAKAVSWRIVGTIDTVVLSFLVTGQIKWALTIGFFEMFSKIIIYYFHERAWERVRAGVKIAVKKK